MFIICDVCASPAGSSRMDKTSKPCALKNFLSAAAFHRNPGARRVVSSRQRSFSHAAEFHRVLGRCHTPCRSKRFRVEQRTDRAGSSRTPRTVSLTVGFAGHIRTVAGTCETTAYPRQACSRRATCRCVADAYGRAFDHFQHFRLRRFPIAFIG